MCAGRWQVAKDARAAALHQQTRRPTQTRTAVETREDSGIAQVRCGHRRWTSSAIRGIFPTWKKIIHALPQNSFKAVFPFFSVVFLHFCNIEIPPFDHARRAILFHTFLFPSPKKLPSHCGKGLASASPGSTFSPFRIPPSPSPFAIAPRLAMLFVCSSPQETLLSPPFLKLPAPPRGGPGPFLVSRGPPYLTH